MDSLTPGPNFKRGRREPVGIDRAEHHCIASGELRSSPVAENTSTNSSFAVLSLCSTRAGRRHDPRAPQRGSRRCASPRFTGGFFFDFSNSSLVAATARGPSEVIDRIVGLQFAEDDLAPLRMQASRDRGVLVDGGNGQACNPREIVAEDVEQPRARRSLVERKEAPQRGTVLRRKRRGEDREIGGTESRLDPECACGSIESRVRGFEARTSSASSVDCSRPVGVA